MTSVQLAGSLADRGDVPIGESCPIDRAMRLVGNRATVLLLREISYGVDRFDSLVARTGITEATAAQRLRELVDGGVLRKEPYRLAGQRTRDAYVLTGSGEALVPVVLALLAWGDAWLPRARDRRVSLSHDGCGSAVEFGLRCAAGHHLLVDEVRVTAGRG